MALGNSNLPSLVQLALAARARMANGGGGGTTGANFPFKEPEPGQPPPTSVAPPAVAQDEYQNLGVATPVDTSPTMPESTTFKPSTNGESTAYGSYAVEPTIEGPTENLPKAPTVPTGKIPTGSATAGKPTGINGFDKLLADFRGTSKTLNSTEGDTYYLKDLAEKAMKNLTGEEADAASDKAAGKEEEGRLLEIKRAELKDDLFNQALQDPSKFAKLNSNERFEAGVYQHSLQTADTLHAAEAVNKAQKQKDLDLIKQNEIQIAEKQKGQEESTKLLAQQAIERNRDQLIQTESLNRLKSANDALANYHVDPNRRWNNMGTLQKVLAGIFLIVGQGAAGMAQGTGKFKGITPVDVWNSAIDDDLRSQELELNAKGQASKGITNEYQLALEQTKNNEAARSLVAANKWKEISERLGILKDQSTNSQIRQDIDVNRAAADQKNLELMQKAQNQVSGSVSEYVTSREKAAAAAAASRSAQQAKLMEQLRKEYADLEKASISKGTRIQSLPSFDQFVSSRLGGPGIKLQLASEAGFEPGETSDKQVVELSDKLAAVNEARAALSKITPQDVKNLSTGGVVKTLISDPDKLNLFLAATGGSVSEQRVRAVLNAQIRANKGTQTEGDVAREMLPLFGANSVEDINEGLKNVKSKLDTNEESIKTGYSDETLNEYGRRANRSRNADSPTSRDKRVK
jgi:hypothetical protein